MRHSRAYENFMAQVNTKDARELYDGWYPGLLDEIYEWERDEVEDAVWQAFRQKNATNFAPYLPKLRRHDGVGALQKALKRCRIPSDASVNMALALYEHTRDAAYLQVVEQNLAKEERRVGAVVLLAESVPSDAGFEILAQRYGFDEDPAVRSQALIGLVYYRGYLTDLRELKTEIKRYLEETQWLDSLPSDTLAQRQAVLQAMQAGKSREELVEEFGG